MPIWCRCWAFRCALLAVESRVRIDAEDHDDLVAVDLDTFDQGADDLALRGEIQTGQTIIDRGGEFFQTIDDQKQLELSGVMLFRGGNLPRDLFKLQFHMRDLGIEIGFVDQSLSITVDQPGFTQFEMALVSFQGRRVGIHLVLLLQPVQTPLIFLLQALGVR